MSTTPPPALPPFIVPSPFDDASPADCILESADGDKFKAYQLVLSLASPVFRTMFELPQGPTDLSPPTKLPLITLTEDSLTLLNLLHTIYPPEGDLKPDIDLDQLSRLYRATIKYDIPLSRMISIARNAFTSTDLLSQKPVEAYALAWRLGLKHEVKVASRYTHGVDLLDPTVLGTMIQLSESVEALSSLLELRKRREVAVRKILTMMNLGNILCYYHGGYGSLTGMAWYNGWDTNRDVAMKSMEDKAKAAFQVPYPNCNDLFTFFGLAEGVPPIGATTICYSTKRCFSGAIDLAAALASARTFPQEITRLPESMTR